MLSESQVKSMYDRALYAKQNAHELPLEMKTAINVSVKLLAEILEL